MKVEGWITWKIRVFIVLYCRQTKYCQGATVLVLTNHTMSSVVPPADSASINSSYTSPTFPCSHPSLRFCDVLPVLLLTMCFPNIPECNRHSRFSTPLASPDFLSSFPKRSGYLTPWHTDLPAFPISRPRSIYLFFSQMLLWLFIDSALILRQQPLLNIKGVFTTADK